MTDKPHSIACSVAMLGNRVLQRNIEWKIVRIKHGHR